MTLPRWDDPEFGFAARQRYQWSHLPIDDRGYIAATELLAMGDAELSAAVSGMRRVRYAGDRNHRNLWRDVLGLDELTGLDVLDFGCGAGLEASELALAGNRVSLADISADNIEVAARVVRLCGQRVHRMLAALMEPPYIDAPDASFDVFYSCGVLHHIPWARQIMERAHALLRPGGQCRLLLYSDQGWREATGAEPPADAQGHPRYEAFLRYFDSVGYYSDWYSEDRLDERFGDLFTTERCEYLTSTRRFLGAVLRRKDIPPT